MITFSELGRWGNLGNQLFEISATIGTAVKHGTSYGFPSWKYESNFSPLPKMNTNYTYQAYHEPHFHYSEISVTGNTDLRGYFQSQKYWSHCEDLIRHHFTFRNPQPAQNSVSVHVRRGDYVKQPQHHPVLQMSYYKAAMEHFKGERFLIFSDDIDWCKKQDLEADVEFSEGRDEITDLALMSQCKGHIIANSSFSWWGAWMSGSKDVIAPKVWFGEKLPHNTADLYLPKWTVI